MTVRIIMVDDHRLLREALREQLAKELDLQVVGEASSGAEALACLNEHPADVLLLDIALPDMTGLVVARRALENHPQLRVIALSGYADRVFVEEMFNAGARGYVVKSAGTHELILAIRSVMAGCVFLSPEVSSAIVGPGKGGTDASESVLDVLGGREREILQLVARGLRSSEIAQKLGIQAGTVDVHRANIRRKLGVRSGAELVRFAIQHGL